MYTGLSRVVVFSIVAVLALCAALALPAPAHAGKNPNRNHHHDNHHYDDNLISRYFGNYPYQGDYRLCGRGKPGKYSTVICPKGWHYQEPLRFTHQNKHFCYIVENHSRKTYFVPMRTNREWEAFRKNCPRDIVIKPCPTEPPDAIDGVCGTANGETLECAPTENLCQSGTPSALMPTENGWAWDCQPSNGGTVAGCWANDKNHPPVQGACGPANGQTLSAAPDSESALCSGGAATSVSGNGPWSWSCIGQRGGGDVDCTAPKAEPPPPPPPQKQTSCTGWQGTENVYYQNAVSMLHNAARIGWDACAALARAASHSNAIAGTYVQAQSHTKTGDCQVWVMPSWAYGATGRPNNCSGCINMFCKEQ